MPKIFLLPLFVILVLNPIQAQSPDTLESYRLLTIADSIYGKARTNYDQARTYYLEARKGYHKAGIYKQEAKCLLRAGNASYRRQDYDTAKITYEELASFTKQYLPDDLNTLATAMSNIAAIYSIKGRYAEARVLAERALELRQSGLGETHKRTGESLYNLGTIYLELGEFDLAINAYRDALPVYFKHYGENDRRVSAVYDNMGILHDKWGDPNRALEYYEKAMEITLANNGPDHWLLAYGYHNSAISLRQLGQHEKAKAYLEKSISIGKPFELADLLSGNYSTLGNLYTTLGDLERSLQYFKTAYSYTQEKLGNEFPKLILYGAEAGRTYSEMGKFEAAQGYFTSAIDLGKKVFKGRHSYIAQTYLFQADMYRKQSKFEAAEQSYDQGLISISRTDGIPDSFDEIMDPAIYFDILKQKAALFEGKYESIAQLTDLQSALFTLEKAISLLDVIRSGYLTDQSKLFLQSNALPLYEHAIDLCHQLYPLTHDESYLRLAFRFSEKNKATLLAGSLQAANRNSFHGISPALLKQEQSLKAQLDQINQLLIETSQETATGGRDSTLSLLTNEQFSIKHTYDSLLTTFRKNHRNYYDLKYNVEVTEAAVVQQSLQAEEALLSYFWGDSSLYAFILTQDHINLVSISNPTQQEVAIQHILGTLNSPKAPFATQAETAFELYQHLVETPLGSNSILTRLIIIPDGVLAYLPFEVLLSQLPESGVGDRDLPYLIRSYAIQYSVSATLLMRPHTTAPSSLAYAGFAPEYGGSQTLASSHRSLEDPPVFGPLLGAQDEVDAAQRLFGGDAYLGSAATESQFKQMLTAPGVLHLAMHAVADDQNPQTSRLIFTNESDSTEDGQLFTYEIYTLTIQSQLAILSGCNTGMGVIKRGEGVMSLSRAFMYAGCPSIAMSLWPARDRSTAQIMSAFCEELLAGQAKDDALQAAKLRYLQSADPLKAHPSNWAAFVLVGDSTALNHRNRLHPAWWVLLGLIGVLGAGILLFRNA